MFARSRVAGVALFALIAAMLVSSYPGGLFSGKGRSGIEGVGPMLAVSTAYITHTIPADSATSVGQGTVIWFYFSEPMNPSTVTPANVKLTRLDTGVEIGGTTYYNTLTDGAYFQPDEYMEFGASYQLTLTSGIKDAGGDDFQGFDSCTFTVQTASDFTQSSGASAISLVTDVKYSSFTVAAGATVTLEGRLDRIPMLKIDGHLQVYGTLNIQRQVKIVAQKLTFHSGCVVNGNIYGDSTRTGDDSDSDTAGGGGAGHGGAGGNGAGGISGGAAYDDPMAPTLCGTAGGMAGAGTGKGDKVIGGKGAAALTIICSGAASLDGTISFNGGAGTAHSTKPISSGGGSGGSFLVSAGSISGSATISANGGVAPAATYQGGGGAGGRVFLESADLNFTGSISVTGCAGYQNGETGSSFSFEREPAAGVGNSAVESDGLFGAFESANQAGHLINTALNGGLYVTQTVGTFSLPGPDMTIALSYNSNDRTTSGPHPLGPGWTHTFNQFLIDQGSGVYTWQRQCGKRITYWDADSDGTYNNLPCHGLADSSFLTGGNTDGTSTIESIGTIPGRAYGGFKLTTFGLFYYFRAFQEIGSEDIALLDTIETRTGRRLTLEYTGTQLNYVQGALDQENSHSYYVRIYFTYTSNLITEITPKYWDGSAEQTITVKRRYIIYDSGRVWKVANGTSASDWYWAYTYYTPSGDELRMQKRELFNNSASHGYQGFTYDGNTNRVATSKIGAESNGMQFSYTTDTGKVEITTRKYDATHTSTYTKYVDQMLAAYREVHMPYDGANIVAARLQFDRYGNVVESIDARGLKTIYEYTPRTHQMLKATSYNGADIVSFSQNVYDEYQNLVESYGPCVVASTSPSLTASPMKETKVEFDYSLTGDGTTYQERHLVREVIKATGDATSFVTRYTYNNAASFYSLASVVSNYGQTSARTTEYTYFSSTAPASYQLAGMLDEVSQDPAGFDIATSYTYYICGLTKTVTDPMGIVSENFIDSMARVSASVSDKTGIESGSRTYYLDSGLVDYTISGDFSSWNLTNPTIDTSQAYAKTEYKYSSTYPGQLIATRGRSVDGSYFGSVMEYYENGAGKKSMSGEVTTWASTPAIITSGNAAYSESQTDYYENGWTKQSRSLIDSGTSRYATVDYEYWSDGAIKHVEGAKYDASNRSESYSYYDILGRSTSTVTLISGTTWATSETEYDTDYPNQVYKTYSPEGQETTYTYDDWTGRRTIVDFEGYKTKTDYDDFGQVVMTTQGYDTGGSEIYSFAEYDDLGRTTKTWTSDTSTDGFTNADSINRVERFYDDNSRVWRVRTYDISSSVSYSDSETVYDDLGRPIASCVDPSGLKRGSVSTLDALGRTVNYEEVSFSSFSGDPASAGYSVSSTLRETEYTYDDDGKLVTSVLNPVGSPSSHLESLTTWRGYDELGRVIKLVDPEQWYQNSRSETGAVHTEYVYNNAGRNVETTVAKSSYPAEDSTTKTEYFDNGSVYRTYYTKDGTNFIVTSTNTYNAAGWLTQIVVPGYNSGNPTSNEDKTTTYTYNLNGQVIEKNDGASRTTAYAYTAAGFLDTVDWNDDASYEKDYTYDALGRVSSISHLGTTQIEYDYDTYGRLQEVTDSSAYTATGAAVGYEYYGSGARSAMTTPDYRVSYRYDTAGAISSLYYGPELSEWKLADWAYSDLGQVTGLTKYDSTSAVIVHTQNDYVPAIGWLAKVENRKQIANPGTNVYSSFKLYSSTPGDSHDSVGNKKYREYSNGDTMSIVYNSRYLPTEETRDNVSNTNEYTYTWTYDRAGNLASKNAVQDGSQASYIEYVRNPAGQIITETTYDSSAKTTTYMELEYEYDGEGNISKKNTDWDPYSATDEYWQYTYNYDNQPTLVQYWDGFSTNTMLENEYNVLGYWTVREEQGAEKRSVYAGQNCVHEYDVDADETNYYIPGGSLAYASLNGTLCYPMYNDFHWLANLASPAQVTLNTTQYNLFGTIYNTTGATSINYLHNNNLFIPYLMGFELGTISNNLGSFYSPSNRLQLCQSSKCNKCEDNICTSIFPKMLEGKNNNTRNDIALLSYKVLNKLHNSLRNDPLFGKTIERYYNGIDTHMSFKDKSGHLFTDRPCDASHLMHIHRHILHGYSCLDDMAVQGFGQNNLKPRMEAIQEFLDKNFMINGMYNLATMDCYCFDLIFNRFQMAISAMTIIHELVHAAKLFISDYDSDSNAYKIHSCNPSTSHNFKLDAAGLKAIKGIFGKQWREEYASYNDMKLYNLLEQYMWDKVKDDFLPSGWTIRKNGQWTEYEFPLENICLGITEKITLRTIIVNHSNDPKNPNYRTHTQSGKTFSDPD